MRELTLRPIRRQCFVPGCRNINSFIATRSREMPVGVILCAECAKDIYQGLYPEAKAPAEEAEADEATGDEATAEEAPHKVEITERKTAPRRKKAEGESAQ